MPLLRIQHYPSVRQVFIACDDISDLATVEIVTGAGPGRRVVIGSTANQHLAAGVARGAVVSGALVRVVTHGIVSGVKTVDDISAGDRLAIANSGMVTPFKTIAPLINLISGTMASGAVGVDGQALVGTSGLISGVTGIQEITTGRVLGRALTSGLSGFGVQMLVCLE